MRYVSERLRMIIVSRFELPLWCSIVFFIGGIGAYFCLVYNTLVETFTTQRTPFFNSAVTWPLYYCLDLCFESSNYALYLNSLRWALSWNWTSCLIYVTWENVFWQALEILCRSASSHLNDMVDLTIWLSYFCFVSRFQQVLRISYSS